MKTNYFSILALALMLAFSGAAYSSQPEERPTDKGQSGNGGGGITRNGRYMTFYSAGFYTEPMEATPDEVPQLAQLIHYMNTTQYMSEFTKVQYASNLVPSAARRYFKVQANTFTPEVRVRLLAEYGRIMKVNVNEVALFAITDTESKTTYLFPEFYSLKPAEQQAILFHETYWLINPYASYERVIQIEMAFQAHIENPTSAEKLLRFLRVAGYQADVLVAAIRTDLKNGSLVGLLNKKNNTPTISLINLVGTEFINCKMRGYTSACFPFVHTHAYQLSLKYPNSLFIKLFYDSVSTKKVSLSPSPGIAYLSDKNYDFFRDAKQASPQESWADYANAAVNLNSIGYGGNIAATAQYSLTNQCRVQKCSKGWYNPIQNLYLAIGLSTIKE